MRQEAEILSQLNHPNIIKLIKMEEKQDNLYFFMELIEVFFKIQGGSLQELID